MKNPFFKATSLVVILVLTMMSVGTATAAPAADTIGWNGQGAEHLPCDGAHWVLAPAQGITGATLYVNGVAYPMSQSGNGSWSADSAGALDDSLSASVTYSGVFTGNGSPHLQLSHCLEGDTEEDPTPTPTPTATEEDTCEEEPCDEETPQVTPTATPKPHRPPECNFFLDEEGKIRNNAWLKKDGDYKLDHEGKRVLSEQAKKTGLVDLGGGYGACPPRITPSGGAEPNWFDRLLMWLFGG